MKIPRNVKHISSRTRCRAESPSSPLSLSPQSLLSPLSLCLSHSPSLPSTHAHPRCSASTCNLELHFPFPLSPISPSHNPHSLSPLSVSHMHTCACTPRTRFPFELSWQLSPPSPLHLRLSLFLSSSSPQFKSRTHFIVSTGMKPVQPCKEHYVIIWQSLMMLTLTDGWKAKHIEWIWNSTMLFLFT